MREIKFRGQRIDNKKWAYGYYYYDISSFSHLITAPIDRPPSFLEPAGENYNEHYEVDPKTVGQFTGRRNINGKEIYEGDIVTTKHQKLAVVIWDSSFACFGTKTIDEDVTTEIMYSLNDIIEIKGNIHDNPELLTQV